MLLEEGKIKSLELSNFMIFDNFNITFSKHINVISGDNATGKSILLKLLYASLKAISNSQKDYNKNVNTREKHFIRKFQGIFRPDNENIGRLVTRQHGKNTANISINFYGLGHDKCNIKFSNRQKNHMTVRFNASNFLLSNPLYIPPKEIISSTENFGSLYRDYQIAFEETYADLCFLLEKPLKKSPNTKEQNDVIDLIKDIIKGQVFQKNRKFYLSFNDKSTFEMGQVSEGYRKLATIMYLIQSGSLDKNSILFWDEPENNMHPKTIVSIVDILCQLANMGIQVIIATHSLFIQQVFDRQTRKNLDIQFFSLFQDGRSISVNSANSVNELKHNVIMESAIMEEFEPI